MDNIAVANCVKTMSYAGFDRVYNVCNGTVTDIPWSPMYYVLGFLGLVFCVGFVVFLWFMMRDTL